MRLICFLVVMQHKIKSSFECFVFNFLLMLLFYFVFAKNAKKKLVLKSISKQTTQIINSSNCFIIIWNHTNQSNFQFWNKMVYKLSINSAFLGNNISMMYHPCGTVNFYCDQRNLIHIYYSQSWIKHHWNYVVWPFHFQQRLIDSDILAKWDTSLYLT